MFKLMRKIRQNDSGSGEVIATLFMTPIVLWLIFSLIDVSAYFQARTSVQNAARDGARQVAIWGGNNSPLNPTTQSVAQITKNNIYNASTGKCTPGACKQPPKVTCTPDRTAQAGQQVSCTIVYYYQPAASGNPFTGFTGFLNNSFTITETARAETGIR